MIFKAKHFVKKILAMVGLFHPSLGVKISGRSKADIIVEHKTPELKVFIETGTFKGDMIGMVGSHFDMVYSIELDNGLYKKARERFFEKENVKLFVGDSAVELKKILVKLNEPALFWLDAHAPGALTFKNPKNCPVELELRAIFAHHIKGHVILIDDARKFDLHSISAIKELTKINNRVFKVKDGLFRIYEK